MDSEQPLALAATIDELAAGQRRALRRRIAVGAGVALALAAIATLWLFTPLRHWVDARRIVAAIGEFGASPFAPAAALAAFVVGGLLIVPVNVLIAACVLVFGPWSGALYALLGVELSALVLYEIGRHLSITALRHRFGARMRGLGARLQRHGVLAVTLVRIVPVAPYSVVSLVAGAAHVGRAQYALGTALGMLPGIVVNALFIDRVIAAIAHPGPWTYALLALAVVAIGALALFARRLFARPVGDA